MAFPLAVMAKLRLITARNHSLTPLLTSLLWPFLLKFLFSFHPIQETCADLAHTVRRLCFQIRLIIYEREPRDAAGNGSGSGAVRWQRALGLVYERINHARRARATAADQENLHALSVMAL